MAKKSSRRRSEQERAERHCANRERLRRAAEELLSSEGWARWVRVRASFRSYSAGNCMLLAHQCHERGIDPQHIAGFRSWLKLGGCVRKAQSSSIANSNNTTLSARNNASNATSSPSH